MSKSRKKPTDRILATTLSMTLATCFTPLSVFAAPEQAVVQDDKKQVDEVKDTPVLSELAKEFKKTESPSEPESEKVREEEKTEEAEPATERKEFNIKFDIPEDKKDTVKIFLNEQESTKITAKKDDEISFEANALTVDKQLYRLGSVKIGEKSLFEDELNGKESYQGKFTLTQEMIDNADKDGNITVSVEMIQVYQVNFEFNASMGKIVKADDENTELGKITLNQDENCSFVAVPEENYRVSEIVVDGNSEKYTENSNRVTKSLDPNQNHDVTVTFALNQYQISMGEVTENGTVDVKAKTVDYGGKTTVMINPDENYYIKNIRVNDTDAKDIKADVPAFNINNNILTLENVTENKAIHVEFAECPKASESDFEINTDNILSSDETGYVISKGKEIIFKTEKKAIRLIDENNKVIQSYNKNEVSLASDTVIKSVELYYADSEYAKETWHTVAFAKKISFYNGTEVKVGLPELSDFCNCYNGDVELSLDIPLLENYPEVAKIEYWVNDETEHKELKNPAARKIIISAEKYNRQKLTVHVIVTDTDGHTQNASSDEFIINTTAPTVDVSIDGKMEENATEGCYRGERTATVKINDWKNTFSQDTDKIFSIKKDGTVLSADEKNKMVSWNTDTMTATIHFVDNGEYEWSVLYTNLAGSHNTGIATENGESLYNFTIDNEMPTANVTAYGKTWNDILQVLTFGIFGKSEIEVTIKDVKDNISGIKEVSYFIDEHNEELADISENPKAKDVLDRLPFTVYENPIKITANTKAVVYARIMDNAGNVTYISSDGFIMDNRLPQAVTISTTDGVYDESTGIRTINGKTVFNVKAEEFTSENGEDVVFSGIRRVYYTVKKDNTQIGEEHELYAWDSTKESELKKEWSDNFTFNPAENPAYNQDNICIEVTVEDNSGNSYSTEYPVSVNIDTLTALVSFDEKKDVYNSNRLNNSYFTSRTATVTISNDRDGYFNEENANQAILKAVSATKVTDGSGKEITSDSDKLITIGEWQTYGNTHTVEVEFNYNGNYTWKKTQYTNKAGNSVDLLSRNEISFTIDTIGPTGRVKVENNTWDKILEVLTFGLYKNDKYEVSVEYEDTTSPVRAEYYITYNGEILSQKLLDSLKDNQWTEYTKPITISDEAEYIVYFRITDGAGNYIYVSSGNMIIDKTKPNIYVFTDGSTNGGKYNNSYKEDGIPVSISAVDFLPCSGLKLLKYWIEVDGKVAEKPKEILFESVNGEPPRYSFTEDIVIYPEQYNSSNVFLKVQAVDNAGNGNNADDIYSVPLDIDITEPKITVSYNNNSDFNGNGCFNESRTATVVITERDNHFDSGSATRGIKITAVDDKGQAVNNAYTISKWKTEQGSTPDECTHTATITYNADAKYTFDISYTDTVGNSNNGVDIGDYSVAPYEFTIDTTSPWGKLYVNRAGERLKEWTETVNTENKNNSVNFDMFKNYPLEFGITGDDSLAGIKEIAYLVVDYKENLTNIKESELKYNKLEELYYAEESPFITVENDEEFKVSPDKKVVVYARIMDNAGNVIYIGSDGFIADNHQPEIIKITADKEDSKEIQNRPVTLSVEVSDIIAENQAFSGINNIYYNVYAENNSDSPIGTGQLYQWNKSEGKLRDEWTGSFTLDAKTAPQYNADNLKIVIVVVDNAGNEYTSDSENVSINVDDLSASVIFDADQYNENRFSDKHFTSRTATVTISNDRSTSFDKEAVEQAIIDAISATEITDRGTGNLWTKRPEDLISIKWESSDENRNEHKATVEFNYCGNYTWNNTEYVNKAGNSVELLGEDEISFTIDNVKPTGSITIEENTWDTLLEVLTFGLYSKEKYHVSAQADDFTSDVKIEYYISHATESEKDNLDYVNDWQEYSNEFDIEEPDEYVVYLKITDQAGNYIYLCSDGHIIDKSVPDIKLTPENAVTVVDEKPVYNKKYKDGVKVNVSVNESEPYAGLKSVEYWVTADGVETQRETIYSFESESPIYSDLVSHFEGIITVDTKLNNSSNVIVYVKSVDNAGNEDTKSVALDIDMTAPEILVSYDNNHDYNGNTYFDTVRTATVEITERTNHFDSKSATGNISIKAVDVNGNSVENAFVISEWNTITGNTPDEDKHTATISYNADANYTFAISYTDKAQNQNTETDTGKSVAPYKFTVDTTKPTGTVTAFSAEGRKLTWDTLADNLNFGFWSNTNINVSGTSDDRTSPIASVKYYKVSSHNTSNTTKPLTENELQSVTAWSEFDEWNGLNVQPNEQFVIYLKIMDMAGNTQYISTDGLIVDNDAPHEEFTAPEINITPEQTASGIYNGNVPITIHVEDPLTGGTYSGLRTINYRVLNMGVETQTGTLYSFDSEFPQQNELLQTWTGEITVDSTLNNSNDVTIEVYAEDNAQNGSSENTSIKIDITAPTIQVSYDNNTSNGELFKDSRTARVAIMERNFSEEYVTLLVNGEPYQATGWSSSGGTDNGDNTIWTADIPFTADGDYTFSVECTDLASNPSSEVDYGESAYPTKFTVDGTNPEISVEFIEEENINVDNYYQNPRTARITIDELHFDNAMATEGVKCSVITDAHDNSKNTSVALSEWTHIPNTNKYVATMQMQEDAKYHLDVRYTDMAGNAGESYQTEFYVDNTDPELSVSVNNSEKRGAYSGEIKSVISYDDTNFDKEQVEISMSGVNVDVTDCNISDEELVFTLKNEAGDSIEWKGRFEDVLEEGSSKVYGRELTFENFPEGKNLKDFDDIYTLIVSLTDKSGRMSSQELVFSVNRFGSTYDITQIKDVLGTYSQISPEIVVSEVNPDELKEHSITLFKNNETITLNEGSDYTISVIGETNEWHEYIYTIPASNFTDDGIYNVTLHSVDKADNISENTLDTKDSAISFAVDNTPPKAIVANLESDSTYDENSRRIVMTADDNLLLSGVAVYLDDSSEALKKWNENEIAQILGNENAEEKNFEFEISGNSTKAHTLKVVCTDKAGNKTELEYDGFYITTNMWIRYINNKSLLFGSIAGILILAGGIVFVVTRKKKNY